MLLQRQDNDDDAVLGEILTIAEYNVSDISDAESVNENAAGLYMVDHVSTALTDLKYITCVKHHNILFRDPEGDRKFLLCHSVAVFAVDRDRKFRAY